MSTLPVGNIEPRRPLHPLAAVLFVYALVLNTAAFAFERHTAHGGPVKGLALSPDGRWLASTSFDYTAVLWALPNFTERRRLIGHEAAVNAAAFSPDGRYLVTAGDDGALRAWRIDDLLSPAQEPVPRVMNGHTGKITQLAFSPDGRWLASSSWDETIGLWSVPAFERSAVLDGHDSPVNAAQFSRDGRSLFSAGGDGRVLVWDVGEARPVRTLVNNGWGINVLAVDDDLDVLAYGATNGLMRSLPLSGSGGAIEYTAEGPPVLSLVLDGATQRIAFGDAEGRVLIADLRSGEVERDFRALKGPIWGMLLMPQGEAVAVAGLDDFVTRIPLIDFQLPRLTARHERRFHPGDELDNGARQFARKCSVCHSLDADDKRRAGPTLYGIFGRKAGAVAGYPYSRALADTELVWSEETIDALFREGPDVVTPGSKMPLQRIKNGVDRRDLIHFLKSTVGPATSR